MLLPRVIALVAAVLAVRLISPWLCGLGASAWLDGDPNVTGQLANDLIAFEASDDRARARPTHDRFAGEWALVTHQMTALGLAQLALAHPDDRARLAPEVTRAALKSFRPEMRGFGTTAWGGED